MSADSQILAGGNLVKPGIDEALQHVQSVNGAVILTLQTPNPKPTTSYYVTVWVLPAFEYYGNGPYPTLPTSLP